MRKSDLDCGFIPIFIVIDYAGESVFVFSMTILTRVYPTLLNRMISVAPGAQLGLQLSKSTVPLGSTVIFVSCNPGAK